MKKIILLQWKLSPKKWNDLILYYHPSSSAFQRRNCHRIVKPLHPEKKKLHRTVAGWLWVKSTNICKDISFEKSFGPLQPAVDGDWLRRFGVSSKKNKKCYVVYGVWCFWWNGKVFYDYRGNVTRKKVFEFMCWNWDEQEDSPASDQKV